MFSFVSYEPLHLGASIFLCFSNTRNKLTIWRCVFNIKTYHPLLTMLTKVSCGFFFLKENAFPILPNVGLQLLPLICSRPLWSLSLFYLVKCLTWGESMQNIWLIENSQVAAWQNNITVKNIKMSKRIILCICRPNHTLSLQEVLRKYELFHIFVLLQP